MTFYLIMVLINFILTYENMKDQGYKNLCLFSFITALIWPIVWIDVLIKIIKNVGGKRND